MNDLITQFGELSLDNVTSRRSALRRTGQIGLGAAIVALPFIRPGRASAQSMGSGDVAVLNYALTLEYLERAFYRKVEATNLVPANAKGLFTMLREDEEAHVTLLSGAISKAGGDPVDYTDEDFTFTPFLSSYANIATLAQGLEDTGVRAYKGQAGAISNKDYLTVALQIHSVEARHAAAIRRLADSPAKQGWIPRDQPGAPAAIAPVYAAGNGFPSEDNVTQGGVDLVNAFNGKGYTRDDITEAFDEGLDKEAVLAIAGQFITGKEGDGK